VAFELQILVDRQSLDSRTTSVCQIFYVIQSSNLNLCPMIQLTLMLTLNDPHDALPDPN